ncbi:hypothetical protein C2E23DRAFT_143906 [Lenzites betulinus]|nr:hypothetical protein C2E23DRAFT_143906 [Lenzites betulinus]
MLAAWPCGIWPWSVTGSARPNTISAFSALFSLSSCPGMYVSLVVCCRALVALSFRTCLSFHRCHIHMFSSALLILADASPCKCPSVVNQPRVRNTVWTSSARTCIPVAIYSPGVPDAVTRECTYICPYVLRTYGTAPRLRVDRLPRRAGEQRRHFIGIFVCRLVACRSSSRRATGPTPTPATTPNIPGRGRPCVLAGRCCIWFMWVLQVGADYEIGGGGLDLVPVGGWCGGPAVTLVRPRGSAGPGEAVVVLRPAGCGYAALHAHGGVVVRVPVVERALGTRGMTYAKCTVKPSAQERTFFQYSDIPASPRGRSCPSRICRLRASSQLVSWRCGERRERRERA